MPALRLDELRLHLGDAKLLGCTANIPKLSDRNARTGKVEYVPVILNIFVYSFASGSLMYN
jgi:hypothetical protein